MTGGGELIRSIDDIRVAIVTFYVHIHSYGIWG